MNKLISRNPVKRFKLGLKILKFQNPPGPLTPIWQTDYEVILAPVEKGTPGSQNTRAVMLGAYNRAHQQLTQVPYTNADKSPREPSNTSAKLKLSRNTSVRASNLESFKTAFNNARNAGLETFSWNGKTFNTKKKGEENYIFQNGKWVSPTNEEEMVAPPTSSVEVNPNWTFNMAKRQFVPVLAQAATEEEGPSFYGEGIADFNRGSIRGFRNLEGGFRNVDEYYNWLNNNQNSDLYKLWNNVLEGMDEKTRRSTFDKIMNQFGIAGNLGRRDSGRLANVLNILRDLGVNGSENQKAFMDAYNNAPANNTEQLVTNNIPYNSAPSNSMFASHWNTINDWRNKYSWLKPTYNYSGTPTTLKNGGNILPSRNPVTRFKMRMGGRICKFFLNGGAVTSLKTGGSIPKYQLGNLILEIENRRNQINSIANEAANIVTTNIQSTKKLNDLVRKASAKPKKNYVQDIVGILKALWDIGAFKGVKDRHGHEATLETAVDGINGSMTYQALANAKKMGYVLKNNSFVKNSNNSNKTTSRPKFVTSSGANFPSQVIESVVHSLSKAPEDSHNTNLQAIFDHKKRFNVTQPYAVIDKNNNTLSVYIGDRLLESHPVTLGKSIGDGMMPLNTRYLSQAPRTTGAGIYTVSSRPTSPYPGNEPMFVLRSDSIGSVSQAIHSPANYTNRLAPFKDSL